MILEVEQQTLESIKKAHTLKGETYPSYKGMYSNVAEWLEDVTKKNLSKPCLRYYSSASATPESYTYQEINKKVNRIINFLVMKLGIRRGDTIATVLTNHPDTLATYLAGIKLGAILVPISPDTPDKNLLYCLQNVNTKVVISQDKYINRLLSIKPSIPTLKYIIKLGEMRDDETILFHESVSISSPIFSPKEITTLDDAAIIIYTVGTTELPRGVVLTQYNLLVNAANIKQALSYTENTRTLSVLPLYYINEFVTSIMSTMSAGGTIVMVSQFEPALCSKLVGLEKINFINIIPSLLQECTEHKDIFKSADLSSFKCFISGRGALAPKLVSDVSNLGLKIIQGYGLSEVSGYATLVPPDLSPAEYKQWAGTTQLSAGLPLNNIEITILDESGNELPAGKEGEVVIRGHSVMKGYHKLPEVNAETFKYGWFHTGDIGSYQKGPKDRLFLFISRHLKDVINRAGTKIAPAEIESALYEIGGVKWGIILGFENKWTEEEVGAYVVPEKDNQITDKEIIEYCRSKLGAGKCPKVVVFGKEIPEQISRRALRQQLSTHFTQWVETKFEE